MPSRVPRGGRHRALEFGTHDAVLNHIFTPWAAMYLQRPRKRYTAEKKSLYMVA